MYDCEEELMVGSICTNGSCDGLFVGALIRWSG